MFTASLVLGPGCAALAVAPIAGAATGSLIGAATPSRNVAKGGTIGFFAGLAVDVVVIGIAVFAVRDALRDGDAGLAVTARDRGGRQQP
jgi:hypothetical protein